MEPLNLVKRTVDIKEFEKLNDTSLLHEISCRYRENPDGLREAYELVDRILKRDFYKTVIDEAELFTSDQIKKYSASELLRMLAEDRKAKLEQLYNEEEKDGSPELFIDTPYEIKMSPLQEMLKSNIDIYDETENVVKKYHDIESERSFKTLNVESFNIYRIYAASSTERKKLIPFARRIMERKEPAVDTQI